MINKRGKLNKTTATVIVLVVIFGLFSLGWFLVQSGWFSNVSDGVDTATEAFSDNPAFSWLGYIFGDVPAFLANIGVSPMSAQIVVVAVWLLITVTFFDVLWTFGTFSRPVSLIVAILLGIIAANLNGIVTMIALSVGLFVFAGSAAVFIGMFAAFVAFFAVNWGVKSLSPWLEERRTMREADLIAAKRKAGGKKTKGSVEGLNEAGEGLEKA